MPFPFLKVLFYGYFQKSILDRAFSYFFINSLGIQRSNAASQYRLGKELSSKNISLIYNSVSIHSEKGYNCRLSVTKNDDNRSSTVRAQCLET